MAKKNNQELIDELTENMNQAIQNYKIDPKQEIELLRYLNQFRKYSVRNTTLIQSQYSGAYGVASFKQHKENGYHVNKGEKALRIFAPKMETAIYDNNNKFVALLKQATDEQKAKLASNEYHKEQKIKGYLAVPVFDITQTDCPPEDYPKLYPNRPENFEYNGTEEQLEHFYKAIEAYASDKQGVPILKDKTGSAAKGYYVPEKHVIVLRDDLTKTEEIRVLLHELAHSEMHRYKEVHSIKDTRIMEYQAEMTAFVVSSAFELDTEDYSKNYLASWTKREVDDKEYMQSVEEVKKVSNKLIDKIVHRYNQLEHGENLVEERVAVRTGLLTDKDNGNHYIEEKDQMLKATKINIKEGERFNINYLKLASETGKTYTVELETAKTTTNDLKKWQAGMTGKEWLETDLRTEIIKKQPDLINTFVIRGVNDKTDQELDLQDISKTIQERSQQTQLTR